MVNGWKVIAIIFIILFILETIGFLVILKIGSDIVRKKEICQWEICEGYDAFSYDEYGSMCYCYEDDEVAKTQKVIG